MLSRPEDGSGFCRAARTPCRVRCQSGFTLIELLVVLTILGFMIGLALPTISSSFTSFGLDHHAGELTGALREARSDAILGGRTVTFSVLGGSRGWRIGDLVTALPEGMTVDAEVAPNLNHGDGARSIAFFGHGGSTGGRITIASPVRRRLITVNWMTGLVQIQNP